MRPRPGVSPKTYVDGVAGEIRAIWDAFGVSYDGFIRTTDPQHERVVQKIFRKLYEQGDIYKGSYEGHYCKPCESFWTDSQIVDGCCPDCGARLPARARRHISCAFPNTRTGCLHTSKRTRILSFPLRAGTR